MKAQRQNVLSWDDTFMAIAEVAKQRSKDPVTQVGACVVTSDNRILTIGYNGAPNGYNDDEFPWDKTSENELERKHLFVVHAERNAILNFRGSFREFSGSTIYITLFPCNECAKEIVQAGIKNVVYLEMPENIKNTTKASIQIFEATGIKTRKLKE